jgi:hypothetical protein
MLADQFSQIFREEHRQVRDLLLALIQAFRERDLDRIWDLLGQGAAFIGPHFRYEEEALYPALVGVYGEDYIEQLLREHDGAIRSSGRLMALADQPSLSADDVAEATGIIRGILPHVSDCDGLSIMAETLPDEQVQTILDARERSLAAGLDLFQWVQQVRARPARAV